MSVPRKYRNLLRKNIKEKTDDENRIKKLINSGFKPDMVIIDYFECLVPEKGGFSTDTNWDREGRTMRKLENMANDLDIALWVTTQGGRNSITADVLTADMGAGSIKKQQIAHVIISVARNLDGQNSNSATMCVVKNRGGLAGKTFHNIIYNNNFYTIRFTIKLSYFHIINKCIKSYICGSF